MYSVFLSSYLINNQNIGPKMSVKTIIYNETVLTVDVEHNCQNNHMLYKHSVSNHISTLPAVFLLILLDQLQVEASLYSSNAVG